MIIRRDSAARVFRRDYRARNELQILRRRRRRGIAFIQKNRTNETIKILFSMTHKRSRLLSLFKGSCLHTAGH